MQSPSTKVDIRNAFRLCPVAPSDWHLLGIKWNGLFYHEKVLPFGLRSSPCIFNKFATSLNWILKNICKLAHIMHYLDDFLDVCTPNRSVAAHHRALILDMFAYLGVPVAEEKVEGPTTVLTYLGLELDTDALEIRLPLDKLTSLRDRVSEALHSGAIQKRDLASLLGHLSFASRAVPAGRTFLRRMYDFDMATKSMRPNQRLVIPDPARGDLRWWRENLQAWSGKSYFLFEQWMPAAQLHLQTDASGSVGFGAFYNGRWLRGEWSAAEQPQHITFKEMYAIVVACATWGPEWSRMRIEFQCDNMAVVDCMKSGTSRSKPVMHLVRSLYSLCVKYNFLVRAVHIPGSTNVIADALSRNLLQVFKTLAPSARPEPDTPVLPLPV